MDRCFDVWATNPRSQSQTNLSLRSRAENVPAFRLATGQGEEPWRQRPRRADFIAIVRGGQDALEGAEGAHHRRCARANLASLHRWFARLRDHRMRWGSGHKCRAWRSRGGACGAGFISNPPTMGIRMRARVSARRNRWRARDRDTGANVDSRVFSTQFSVASKDRA